MRKAIIERVALYSQGINHVTQVEEVLENAGFFELLDILEAVEWKGVASWGMEEEGCPICHSERIDGHKSGCKLAAAIAKAKGT